MRLITLAFFTIALLGIGIFQANAETCAQITEKKCEIRKSSTCGPVTLQFRRDEAGAARCERASMHLTPTDVIPQLRRVHCFLFGDNTSVRFDADNYLPISGPKNGDTIALENGTADILINGKYKTMSNKVQVSFENIGPGETVVLKCAGFGPA